MLLLWKIYDKTYDFQRDDDVVLLQVTLVKGTVTTSSCLIVSMLLAASLLHSLTHLVSSCQFPSRCPFTLSSWAWAALLCIDLCSPPRQATHFCIAEQYSYITLQTDFGLRPQWLNVMSLKHWTFICVYCDIITVCIFSFTCWNVCIMLFIACLVIIKWFKA